MGSSLIRVVWAARTVARDGRNADAYDESEEVSFGRIPYRNSAHVHVDLGGFNNDRFVGG